MHTPKRLKLLKSFLALYAREKGNHMLQSEFAINMAKQGYVLNVFTEWFAQWKTLATQRTTVNISMS